MAAGPSLADAPLARPTLASGDRGLCPTHQTLPLVNDLPAPAQVHQHPERDSRTLDRLTSWRQLGAATSVQRPSILVSGESTRPAASRMMLAGLRAFDCDRMLEAPHPRQARCRQRWMVGNLSGNPGATTRHYGTALDEMGPAPEQP
jgi:hypothetical protein